MFEKEMKEIEIRKNEIKGLVEKSENIEEVRSLNEEVIKLNEGTKLFEEKRKMAEAIKEEKTEIRQIEKPMEGVKQMNEREKRGQELLEKRAVTVGSSVIVLDTHVSEDIKPTFNQVSGLMDRVNIKPLVGGESFKQSYIKGYGEGGYTAEEADYASAEPTFGYADVNKVKITAYAEDTEELIKLSAANYDEEVMKGISVATRKKITKEILVGDGTTGHFVGIFDDGATAIDPSTDKAIAIIDEKTLDEIVFSFGGDEDVEDAAVLILNKRDLKAFVTLRNSDGKKVYDVVSTGNTGTIDGVPYIINSACKSIAEVGTTAGQYCMAYGSLSNYTMAIFSDLDVQRSADYKFKQGMIAHKGSIFAGGNVTAHNGFLRIKKGTAV